VVLIATWPLAFWIPDPIIPEGMHHPHWWAIAILMIGSEFWTFELRIQHERQTLSLTELPLVIGLFTLSPWLLVAARVVGCGLEYSLHRRTAPLKTALESWGGGTVTVSVPKLVRYPRLVVTVLAGNKVVAQGGLKPHAGVNVVTPNPFSSGSAKWNLLAPYTAKSNGGTNAQAGLDYVSALVKDHVTTQPKSGREASDTFLQGTGDALISYENEAIFLERGGDPVEHVTPPTTFKIENPLAVVKTSTNLATAKAFNDYLYTPAAQTLLAQAGFRPVDEAVAKEYASSFPAPSKLWTIADLGGWKTVDKALFAKDTGTIAVIYDAATK